MSYSTCKILPQHTPETGVYFGSSSLLSAVSLELDACHLIQVVTGWGSISKSFCSSEESRRKTEPCFQHPYPYLIVCVCATLTRGQRTNTKENQTSSHQLHACYLFSTFYTLLQKFAKLQVVRKRSVDNASTFIYSTQ